MSTALTTKARRKTSGKATRAGRSQRRYKPDMERMDTLCLLNAAMPGLDSALDSGTIFVPQPTWQQGQTESAQAADPAQVSHASLIDAWDAAIADQVDSADAQSVALADAYSQSLAVTGYNRMERYLNRAWQKAGIDPPQDEDCTQSVYMVLLERWGRDHFDDLASTVGRNGLSTLVSRETPAGLDFLRALDQIKKQAQRQNSRSTFLMSDTAGPTPDRLSPAPDEVAMGRDLEALISKSLDPREADLIHSTIQGDTPADIAARWGVTPKTVSNVKSEAISKLKVTLADRLDIDFRGQ